MDEIAGDLARGGAPPEDPVDPEALGRVILEAGTADDEQRHPSGRVGLPEGRRHLGDIVQVGVLLGDDLADQDRVGLLGLGASDEVGHEDLGAEVDDLDLGVVLQALLPREALDVEDRVDADGVRIGADAGPHDDEPALERVPDPGVDLLGAEQRELPLDDLDLSQVDTSDGQAILGNIFGSNTDAVMSQLGGYGAMSRGGGSSLLSKLLPLLAPIVMAWLAKKVQGGLGGGSTSASGAQSQDQGGVLGSGQGASPAQQDQPAQSDSGASDQGLGGGGDILGQILGGVLGGAGGSSSSSGAGGAGGDILGQILGGLLGGGKR